MSKHYQNVITNLFAMAIVAWGFIIGTGFAISGERTIADVVVTVITIISAFLLMLWEWGE